MRLHCYLRALLHRTQPDDPYGIDKLPAIVTSSFLPADWPRTVGVQLFSVGGASALMVGHRIAVAVYQTTNHWAPFRYGTNGQAKPAWVRTAKADDPRLAQWRTEGLTAIHRSVCAGADSGEIAGRIEAVIAQVNDEYDRATERFGGGVENDEYQPGQWFTNNTDIPTSRLRQAARKGRRKKRVRKTEKDGVVCYSVKDAKRWWQGDFQKKGGP